MDPRSLATGRRRATVARSRPTRGTQTLEPALGGVEPRAWNCARPGSPTPERVPATLSGRRMTLGAPLLEPSEAIAHRARARVQRRRWAHGAAWRPFRPLGTRPALGRSRGPSDSRAPQMHPKRPLAKTSSQSPLRRKHAVSRNFL
jgi:hypothetical protein